MVDAAEDFVTGFAVFLEDALVLAAGFLAATVFFAPALDEVAVLPEPDFFAAVLGAALGAAGFFAAVAFFVAAAFFAAAGFAVAVLLLVAVLAVAGFLLALLAAGLAAGLAADLEVVWRVF